MQDQQNFLKRCANGGTLFSYATVVSFLFSAYCNSSCVGWITFLYIVLPCVAAVVSHPPWRMLVLLIARYVSNLINEHYYYYYRTTERYAIDCIIHCWGYQWYMYHDTYHDTKKYQVSSIMIHFWQSVSITDTFWLYQYQKSLIHEAWYIYRISKFRQRMH